MTFRARCFLFGGVAIVAAAGLISWHFFGGRGEVLKPDGGPVVTVMDFGRPFPLDPLPSGWLHRKFWTRSPMTMSFAVKDGVASMRFETHDSASMLFRHADRPRRLPDARSIDPSIARGELLWARAIESARVLPICEMELLPF